MPPVEAARAGEAGVGFAVVADEVRNLARKSAEASKNTQDIIDSSIQNIRESTELAIRSDEGFAMFVQVTDQLADHLKAIGESSEDQYLGVAEIEGGCGQHEHSHSVQCRQCRRNGYCLFGALRHVRGYRSLCP